MVKCGQLRSNLDLQKYLNQLLERSSSVKSGIVTRFGFQSPTGPRGVYRVESRCGPFIQLSMCENITIQLIGFGKIAFKK